MGRWLRSNELTTGSIVQRATPDSDGTLYLVLGWKAPPGIIYEGEGLLLRSSDGAIISALGSYWRTRLVRRKA